MQNRNIIGKTENLSKYLTSFTDNLKEEYSRSSFISSKTLIGLQLTSLSLLTSKPFSKGVKSQALNTFTERLVLTSGVINNNTTPAISFVELGLMGFMFLLIMAQK